jgi:hypothetical protein
MNRRPCFCRAKRIPTPHHHVGPADTKFPRGKGKGLRFALAAKRTPSPQIRVPVRPNAHRPRILFGLTKYARVLTFAGTYRGSRYKQTTLTSSTNPAGGNSGRRAADRTYGIAGFGRRPHGASLHATYRWRAHTCAHACFDRTATAASCFCSRGARPAASRLLYYTI